eukprot:scaffold10121_cov112-Isochrysis_galbana.AAC.10
MARPSPPITRTRSRAPGSSWPARTTRWSPTSGRRNSPPVATASRRIACRAHCSSSRRARASASRRESRRCCRRPAGTACSGRRRARLTPARRRDGLGRSAERRPCRRQDLFLVRLQFGLEGDRFVREDGQHITRVLVRAADVRYHHPRVVGRSLLHLAAHHDLPRLCNVDEAVGAGHQLHHALRIGARRLVARRVDVEDAASRLEHLFGGRSNAQPEEERPRLGPILLPLVLVDVVQHQADMGPGRCLHNVLRVVDEGRVRAVAARVAILPFAHRRGAPEGEGVRAGGGGGLLARPQHRAVERARH